MKSTFKDATGFSWSITIDGLAIARLRAEEGIDLRKRADYARLANDPAMFARVLWCTVESQAMAAGIGPEEFGKRLAACSEQAAEALILAAVGAAHGFGDRIKNAIKGVVGNG